ncbi:hypothetical protein NMK71_00990 [Weeksellaceae bacterium KMM 9713]|uniref:Uncharacterized protein n=1 Tax=Profundicola chukchiensis TaxID=2961959 RepID=A0A9X4MUB7_9FLAO|nr:hypothetical protein [Profundicola chukchiensis]MDG4944978.1 hypothetical protein [Profundicola chukchiensis]
MNKINLQDLEKEQLDKTKERQEAEARISKAVEDYVNPPNNKTWKGKKL